MEGEGEGSVLGHCAGWALLNNPELPGAQEEAAASTGRKHSCLAFRGYQNKSNPIAFLNTGILQENTFFKTGKPAVAIYETPQSKEMAPEPGESNAGSACSGRRLFCLTSDQFKIHFVC